MSEQQDADLGSLIRAQAKRHEAPAALRDQLLSELRSQHAVPARPLATAVPWGGWRQWFNVGAAFACGVLASVLMLQLQAHGDGQELEQEVVSSHIRSLMATHLSDVASTDQHTVKPWFTGKLDFAPPVYDLAHEGYALTGGRLDYIGQRAVAALVYQHRMHTLNVFVWPAGASKLPTQAAAPRQGYNLAAWEQGGMQFWAVSDVSADELRVFTKLMQKGP